MMYYITRLELLTIRDILLSELEEDEVGKDEVSEGLEIVEALLEGKEVTVCQE